MTVQDFLDYELINYSKFQLKVAGLIGIFLVIAGTKVLLILIKRGLLRMSRGKRYEQNRVLSIYQILRYFIWFIAFVIMLTVAGLDLTWLMAGSAALMVGLGLGVQSIFMDIVSGIIILFDGSVDRNDIIQVEETVGLVTKVGLRCTEVQTRSNVVILIPNHKLTAENVINWTHSKSNPRFNVNVGVAYGSDTNLVKEILLEVCKDVSGIDTTPKPFVRFYNFGDSSLDFQLFFWSPRILMIEDVLSNVRFSIDQKFRDHGVKIPFPQRDIHIQSPIK